MSIFFSFKKESLVPSVVIRNLYFNGILSALTMDLLVRTDIYRYVLTMTPPEPTVSGSEFW